MQTKKEDGTERMSLRRKLFYQPVCSAGPFPACFAISSLPLSPPTFLFASFQPDCESDSPPFNPLHSILFPISAAGPPSISSIHRRPCHFPSIHRDRRSPFSPSLVSPPGSAPSPFSAVCPPAQHPLPLSTLYQPRTPFFYSAPGRYLPLFLLLFFCPTSFYAPPKRGGEERNSFLFGSRFKRGVKACGKRPLLPLFTAALERRRRVHHAWASRSVRLPPQRDIKKCHKKGERAPAECGKRACKAILGRKAHKKERERDCLSPFLYRGRDLCPPYVP